MYMCMVVYGSHRIFETVKTLFCTNTALLCHFFKLFPEKSKKKKYKNYFRKKIVHGQWWIIWREKNASEEAWFCTARCIMKYIFHGLIYPSRYYYIWSQISAATMYLRFVCVSLSELLIATLLGTLFEWLNTRQLTTQPK